MRIPPPPRWLVHALFLIALLALLMIVFACSAPLRFDPHRQDLQWKQQRCLDEGKPPPECRP